MEKNVARIVDLDELDALATVGGSDDTAAPNAITTPFCAVIATITVISMTIGMLTTQENICY